MSLMAGIIRRNSKAAVPTPVKRQLRALISRRPNDNIQDFDRGSAYFVKLDIGAFSEPGWASCDNSVTLLAGDPLIGEGPCPGRTSQLRVLRDLLDSDSIGSANCNGVFALAHYTQNSTSDRLTLMTDKLGIRPVFYYLTEEWVVFASALRILEGLSIVDREIDIRGLTEQVALGYPLSDRTPYRGIKLLRSAEMLTVTADSAVQKRYWRWDNIPETNLTEDAHAKLVYEHFAAAVSRRLQKESAGIAYLSGGLDSRCVVTEVTRQGSQLHTFCFALPETQDEAYAADFARRCGTIHRQSTFVAETYPGYSDMMAAAIHNAGPLTPPPERPREVWSGEGGSCLLGFIHVTPSICENMRAGRLDLVLSEYIRNECVAIPQRILGNSLAEVNSILEQGITEELQQFHPQDPARAYHLFLMCNDQSRHMPQHFEDLDVHRLELRVPMFDSEFLHCLFSVPVDLCLRHHFYHAFLRQFPPVVFETPWQIYPGHEACPVPSISGLKYQWDVDTARPLNDVRRRARNQQVLFALASRQFPSALLRRHLVAAAWLLERTGVRNCAHIMEIAATYYKYSSRCTRKAA